eukprot:118845-Chlamydomonas_euryale.AAC.4
MHVCRTGRRRSTASGDRSTGARAQTRRSLAAKTSNGSDGSAAAATAVAAAAAAATVATAAAVVTVVTALATPAAHQTAAEAAAAAAGPSARVCNGTHRRVFRARTKRNADSCCRWKREGTGVHTRQAARPSPSSSSVSPSCRPVLSPSRSPTAAADAMAVSSFSPWSLPLASPRFAGDPPLANHLQDGSQASSSVDLFFGMAHSRPASPLGGSQGSLSPSTSVASCSSLLDVPTRQLTRLLATSALYNAAKATPGGRRDGASAAAASAGGATVGDLNAPALGDQLATQALAELARRRSGLDVDPADLIDGGRARRTRTLARMHEGGARDQRGLRAERSLHGQIPTSLPADNKKTVLDAGRALDADLTSFAPFTQMTSSPITFEQLDRFASSRLKSRGQTRLERGSSMLPSLNATFKGYRRRVVGGGLTSDNLCSNCKAPLRCPEMLCRTAWRNSIRLKHTIAEAESKFSLESLIAACTSAGMTIASGSGELTMADRRHARFH